MAIPEAERRKHARFVPFEGRGNPIVASSERSGLRRVEITAHVKIRGREATWREDAVTPPAALLRRTGVGVDEAC